MVRRLVVVHTQNGCNVDYAENANAVFYRLFVKRGRVGRYGCIGSQYIEAVNMVFAILVFLN